MLHCSAAEQVLLASFLNLSAVVRRLSNYPQVAVVCSGTNRKRTFEDEFLAGAIVRQLQQRFPTAQLSPTAKGVLQQWNGELDAAGQPRDLVASLKTGQGGINLMRRGMDADIKACAQVDTIDEVAWFEPARRRICLYRDDAVSDSSVSAR